VLDAKMGFFYELLLDSEHGLEILDDNNRLCGDITAESGRRYLRILAGVIRDAQARGDFSPQSSGLSPPAAAEFLLC
jgi:TetR/AcrR family transcriptional repressor of mexJK operon